MNRNLNLLIFVLVMTLVFSSSAHAAITLNENRSEMTSEFEVAPEFSYIKYDEPGIADENGFMGGVSGAYTARFPEKWVLGVDGRFSAGQVDYDSHNTGSVDGILDFIIEVRGTAGYDLEVMDNTRLTPYIGIGYRFLRDELGAKFTSTGHVGYDRQTEYVYLPLGIKTLSSLDTEWYLGFNVEFDIFLDGTQKSELGDAVDGVDTLVNDQNTGYGVRGSVQLVKAGDKYDFFVEPFVRYWNIDKSDVKAVTSGGRPLGVVGYEPKNDSTEIGAKLGIHF